MLEIWLLWPIKATPSQNDAKTDLVPKLSQTVQGWKKEYPSTKNKFPVGTDVPYILDDLWMAKDATEVVKAVCDYALIAIYYLFRVGTFTVKGNRNYTNQTVQFKL